MKFLADMGISPKAVAHLKARRFDAVHLIEEDLHRLSDRDILAKARAEGRIVLTHDLDFGDLMAANGAQLPSVMIFRLTNMAAANVIFRLTNMAAANVNRYLDAILREHDHALQQGAILSVTDRRIRVRSLPIDR